MAEDPRIAHFHSHIENLRNAGIEFPNENTAMVAGRMYPTTSVIHSTGPRQSTFVNDPEDRVFTQITVPDERTFNPHSIYATTEGGELTQVGLDTGAQYKEQYRDTPEHEADTAYTGWSKEYDKSGSAEETVQAIPDRLSHFAMGTGWKGPDDRVRELGPQAAQMKTFGHRVRDVNSSGWSAGGGVTRWNPSTDEFKTVNPED